jgi:hypothetical protein
VVVRAPPAGLAADAGPVKPGKGAVVVAMGVIFQDRAALTPACS